MDRSSRQEINKATEVLNYTVDQLDLIKIYGILPPKKPEYIFFFKHAWNVLYNKPHTRSQNKPQQI